LVWGKEMLSSPKKPIQFSPSCASAKWWRENRIKKKTNNPIFLAGISLWIGTEPSNIKYWVGIKKLRVWPGGVVSACHRGDWSYVSWDRIPPGHRVVVLKNVSFAAYYQKQCKKLSRFRRRTVLCSPPKPYISSVVIRTNNPLCPRRM
jgi:hypothetical protein